MRQLLVIIVLFAATSVVPAQNTRLQRYTTLNGFADNRFTCLLQDSRGFLWSGTYDGLNRFDGKTVKIYNLTGANGLTDLRITSLAEDKLGNIWIGTEYGLNKLNPFTEIITPYYEGTGPGTIPYRWCNALYADKHANLWLGTEKGIALYHTATNSFINYPINVFGSDPKINKFVRGFYEDRQGNFWLYTSYGIKLFNRKTKTYTSFHFPDADGNSPRENVIISLHEDHQNNLLAGTWGGGLLRFNPLLHRFEKVKLNGVEGGRLVIYSISNGGTPNDPLLLTGTNDGLFTLRYESDGSFTVTGNNPSPEKTSSFLPAREIHELMYDRQQNLWLAASDGLYKVSPTGNAVKWLTLSDKGSEPVFHLVPDTRQPERYFYLTTPKGWSRYDHESQTITPFALPVNEENLLKNINDWVADANGYWFTSMNGFGYYDIRKNQLLNYTKWITERSAQTVTVFLAKDKYGKIWVSMRRSGLLVYDPATQKIITLFDQPGTPGSTYSRAILDIKNAPDGFMYFTANNRLYRVHPANYSYATFSPPATGMQMDTSKISPDKIIITSTGRMLVTGRYRIYEWRNDSLVTVFPSEGLSSFSIENISEDHKQQLWVSSSKGVFITDPSFRRWKPVHSLVADDDRYSGEIYTGVPGWVLSAGMNRIGILNDSLLPRQTAVPEVIISRVKYGEQEKYLFSLQPSGIRSFYKDPVEIELALCNFLNEQETKLMYRLEGWDDHWKTVTALPVIRYEQLPQGKYTFKTKTVNTEGVESRETEFRFTVVPPFYRTGWFITLCILVTGILVYAFYRYRLRKAVELEKMRTRIATDLHDDIGATLSSISMYSEVLKNQVKEKLPQLEPVLTRMGENSRDMVASMSDIVWAINPGNDDGEKLLQRMESYATDMCAVKRIQLHFTADEQLKKVCLKLEHRKNIYLVFKEAVNNAVKYSEAENIWVMVKLQGKQLHLSVKDDGKGFDEQTVIKGNGLKNLQLRAGEIKGTLTIDSEKGNGTQICLNCMV